MNIPTITILDKPVDFQIAMLERILSKVVLDDSTQCWIYQGLGTDSGYSRFGSNKYHQSFKGHRVLYELLRGPIPDELFLDHKCHDPKTCAGGKTCIHRRCCNPWHVEPATNKENCNHSRAVDTTPIARAAAALKPRKTHCSRGHDVTGPGARYLNGKGECVACRKVNGPERNQQRRERRRLAKSPAPQGFMPARYLSK